MYLLLVHGQSMNFNQLTGLTKLPPRTWFCFAVFLFLFLFGLFLKLFRDMFFSRLLEQIREKQNVGKSETPIVLKKRGVNAQATAHDS